MTPCPLCDSPVNLIPHDEAAIRTYVGLVSHLSNVAACSGCEWAATITVTPKGIVVKEWK